MGFSLTDLAPWCVGRRDLCFAPQHMDYQTMLQKHHMVVDNSGKGQTKVALEVVDNCIVVGPQIELETQAEFDKMFGIELQPAFEDQMDFGVPLGAKGRVEQRQ